MIRKGSACEIEYREHMRDGDGTVQLTNFITGPKSSVRKAGFSPKSLSIPAAGSVIMFMKVTQSFSTSSREPRNTATTGLWPRSPQVMSQSARQDRDTPSQTAQMRSSNSSP